MPSNLSKATEDSAVLNYSLPPLKRTPNNFKLIGQALFGEKDWLIRMAYELQAKEHVVRRWAAGRQPIPSSTWEALGATCRKHGNALLEFADRLALDDVGVRS
jgi:hypothetical protein